MPCGLGGQASNKLQNDDGDETRKLETHASHETKKLLITN